MLRTAVSISRPALSERHVRFCVDQSIDPGPCFWRWNHDTSKHIFSSVFGRMPGAGEDQQCLLNSRSPFLVPVLLQISSSVHTSPSLDTCSKSPVFSSHFITLWRCFVSVSRYCPALEDVTTDVHPHHLGCPLTTKMIHTSNCLQLPPAVGIWIKAELAMAVYRGVSFRDRAVVGQHIYTSSYCPQDHTVHDHFRSHVWSVSCLAVISRAKGNMKR